MNYMSRLFIFFIMLTGLMFLGIFILINPSVFVLLPHGDRMPLQNQTLSGQLVPKEIIVLGSVLTIVGLIGLSVLGFRIAKDPRNKQTKDY